MESSDERIKWLRLGYQTYGLAGANAVATAMGLSPGQSSKPQTSYSGDDRVTSPNHRSRNFGADGTPHVEAFFWAPVGKGESSFGHLSTSIGDTMYSWGPKGMAVEPRAKYLARNQFREALGRRLALGPDEIRQLEQSLRSFGSAHAYGILDANCADPLEAGLEELGYPMGLRLTPKDVEDGVVSLRLSQPNDYRLYRARPSGEPDRRSTLDKAVDAIPSPWSWFFEP